MSSLGATNDHFVVHARVKVRDGGASAGDAIFFEIDGPRLAGELLLSFSFGGGSFSMVSVWRQLPTSEAPLANFSMEGASTRIVPTTDVEVSLTRYRNRQMSQ